jgi:hypothetical protein
LDQTGASQEAPVLFWEIAMLVRRATTEDADKIAAWCQGFVRDEPSSLGEAPAALAQKTSEWLAGSTIFLADDANRIVAAAGVSDDGQIEMTLVNTDWKIAVALVRELERHLADSGHDHAWVYPYDEEDRFYASLGYRYVDGKVDLYGNTMMRRDLKVGA